ACEESVRAVPSLQSGGGRGYSRVLRGQSVRSIKGTAIVVAMMLVTAGCGARLSKAQLAKAAAGGGQNVSCGATGGDQGAALGGDQTAAGGNTASGGGGGATSGAGGAAAGKAGSGGQAQGAASACGATGGNS